MQMGYIIKAVCNIPNTFWDENNIIINFAHVKNFEVDKIKFLINFFEVHYLK